MMFTRESESARSL